MYRASSHASVCTSVDAHAQTEEGLDASHFDVVAGHLVRALKELKVPQALIDEAVSKVAPLRDVFHRDAEAQKAKSAGAH